jgi:predicted transcriptional regulator
MATNFKVLRDELHAKMTPAQLAARNASVARELAQIRLSQMRKVRELSQVALAEKLGTDQGSISRLEKQGDMYLSTLRSYVEGVGGKLELRAVFPGQIMTLDVGE